MCEGETDSLYGIDDPIEGFMKSLMASEHAREFEPRHFNEEILRSAFSTLDSEGRPILEGEQL